MQITFTFETGSVPTSKIVDAFAAHYNYSATVLDVNGQPIANPESKNNFAKRMLRNYIVVVVKAQDMAAATKTIADMTLT